MEILPLIRVSLFIKIERYVVVRAFVSHTPWLRYEKFHFLEDKIISGDKTASRPVLFIIGLPTVTYSRPNPRKVTYHHRPTLGIGVSGIFIYKLVDTF